MGETVENLLDKAEDMIRHKGFHAVSFRDLADELGIKSSSVHYHFPQKQDLGVALVNRYSERVLASLDEASRTARSPQDHLESLINVYREALKGTDRICLCGILGAESSGLPPDVADAVSRFLQANIDWLSGNLPDAMPEREKQACATQAVSTLQGAMMLAHSLGNHDIFDDAVRGLSVGA